jgi:hypothetical protein
MGIKIKGFIMVPTNKNNRRLKKLRRELYRLDTTEQCEIKKLTNSFYDRYPDFDPDAEEYECDANSEYVFELSEIWAKNDNKRRRLEAEYAAKYLISYHVASPNQILHGDDLAKTLTQGRFPKDANTKWISSIIANSQYSSYILNEYAYVHSTLWQKYRVKLLDTNYAYYLLCQKNNLQKQICFSDNERQEQQLQQHLDETIAELGRFHTTVLNEAKERLNPQTKPF